MPVGSSWTHGPQPKDGHVLWTWTEAVVLGHVWTLTWTGRGLSPGQGPQHGCGL